MKNFESDELKKILKAVPDFNKKLSFDINDLYMYDNEIYKKVQEENLYVRIAYINLYTAKYFYGGKNIAIYQSTQENTHYVFWVQYFGD